MGFAREMVLVAVGWQVYDIIAEPASPRPRRAGGVPPAALLALPAGAIADRLSRKLVFIASLAFDASITALLILVSLSGANSLWPFLALVVRERRRRGARQSRCTLDAADPRSARAADERARDPLDRRPGDRGDRAGARRVALRDQPGARLRDRRRALRSWRSPSSRRSGRGPWSRSRCWSAAPVSARCSPGCGSSAGRPCCSARSRSTSSPSCSAARSRCCRSSPVTCSKSGRSGSASFAALRPSARWSPGSC